MAGEGREPERSREGNGIRAKPGNQLVQHVIEGCLTRVLSTEPCRVEGFAP